MQEKLYRSPETALLDGFVSITSFSMKLKDYSSMIYP